MGEAFIVRRGGGYAFAQIDVEYPEGSACTCSNGSKTLTAKTTDGKWVFNVPSTGTWTVTATGSGKTRSESVSITARYQVKSVTLQYDLYLVQSGQKKVQFTTQNADFEEASGGVDFYAQSSGSAYTFVQELGLFNTLKIQSLYSDINVIAVIFRDIGSEYAARVTIEEGQSTLDISSFDGSGYVGIVAEGGWENYIRITEMVLQ